MKKIAFITILVILLITGQVFAKTIYVDNTLTTDITDGSYSITNRDNSGSDGNAYNTVREAIDAMVPGDTIMIRGGTYQEGTISIPYQKNGTSWNEGEYNTICSYPGEWAVLDGENQCDTYGGVLSGFTYDGSNQFDKKYWKFD